MTKMKKVLNSNLNLNSMFIIQAMKNMLIQSTDPEDKWLNSYSLFTLLNNYIMNQYLLLTNQKKQNKIK